MKLLHLEHVEDTIFESGNFIQGLDTLYSITDALVGTASEHLRVTTKYDGSPAIVFGVNPENGKFFVGTKSVFNKYIPKINYTLEDCETNHGNHPGLVNKLQIALELLKNNEEVGLIPDGVYQGDIMFVAGDIDSSNKMYCFTPNTITYGLHEQHPLAYDMKHAELCLVVHTRYEGATLATMEAKFDVNQRLFWSDNKIIFIDPALDTSNHMLTRSQFDFVNDCLVFCEQTWKNFANRDVLTRHSKMLRMFINHCIRIGEKEGSVQMYRVFLKNRNETALALDTENSMPVFRTILQLHRQMTIAKNVIISALNTNSLFYHEVDGVPTAGEGFVVSMNGVPVKFIDRLEFSRLNFANKKYEKVSQNG